MENKSNKNISSFEKNMELESILRKINGLLHPVEVEQMELSGNDFSQPVLLQIGSPRSGSTFFMQWMANNEIAATPNNFLSRFFQAPYIGALISEMIINPRYNYRGEFSDINKDIELKSDIGKTKGFNSPHEFWYFWRQYFNFPDIPTTDEIFIKNADFDSFNKELSLLQQVYNRPFALKAHIINWYLKSMADNMQNAIYIHIHRNPVSKIRSLMKARKNWNGDADNWFSWKPREYEAIKNMDIYHQVAGQIYFIEKTILENRKYLGERYMKFSYEDLCNQPEMIYNNLIDKINLFSTKKITKQYSGRPNFSIANSKSEFDDKKIENAFHYFLKNFGVLNY
ncbi:MAG: sulfotransferase [Prolixibacteraceae bacterium]|nr:sulfotransferase [Prolixibacteraceae bacterium]